MNIQRIGSYIILLSLLYVPFAIEGMEEKKNSPLPEDILAVAQHDIESLTTELQMKYFLTLAPWKETLIKNHATQGELEDLMKNLATESDTVIQRPKILQLYIAELRNRQQPDTKAHPPSILSWPSRWAVLIAPLSLGVLVTTTYFLLRNRPQAEIEK